MSTDQQYERIPEWTLGDRLRKARTLTGLTVAEFAERIGVSDRTINNAEGDKRAVRRITLNAWAMATGVSLEWLESGQSPAGPPPGPGGIEDSPAMQALARQKRSRARGGTTHRYLPVSAAA